jgi:hypothetical protein
MFQTDYQLLKIRLYLKLIADRPVVSPFPAATGTLPVPVPYLQHVMKMWTDWDPCRYKSPEGQQYPRHSDSQSTQSIALV